MEGQNNTENLKERTALGLFWAALGNGAQQVVAMLIGIALARILNVEDYGLVAMLTVFSILAANIQDSGFTSALAVKKDATHEDFNAVFWFSVLTSSCIYILLFFCAPLIAHFNHAPQLVNLGRVIFLGFFFSSFGTAQAAWLIRNLMMREKTTSQVTASLCSGTIGIGCALAGLGCWSLVAMDLSYKITYTLMVWYWSPWRPSLHIDLRPAWRMFGFGSRLLVTNMLNTINGQFLQSILGHYYRPDQIGQYSQANKWTTLANSILVSMVNNVAQPVLAKVEDDEQRQTRVFRKLLRFTCFVSFPAMWGLALIAPEFISLTIGDKWNPCVPYLIIIAFGGAFISVNGVFSNLMISCKHSDYYMYTTSAFLAVQLVLLFAFAGGESMLPLVACIASLQPIWLFVLYFASRKLISANLLQVLSDVVPFALAAGAAWIVGYACNRGVLVVLNHCACSTIVQQLCTITAKFVGMATAYIVLMWLFRVAVFRECVEFVKLKVKR